MLETHGREVETIDREETSKVTRDLRDEKRKLTQRQRSGVRPPRQVILGYPGQNLPCGPELALELREQSIRNAGHGSRPASH